MPKSRIPSIVVVLVLITVVSLFLQNRKQEQLRLNQELMTLASEKDFAGVLEKIEQGASPHGTLSGKSVYGPGGNTVYHPVVHAVAAGNINAVEAFRKAGTPLEHENFGGTLLTVAIRRVNLEMFTYLLKQGCNPNHSALYDFDFNVLHQIIEEVWRNEMPIDNALEFASIAFKYDADPNYKGMHGFTPLFYAVSWQQPELVELFLKHGADYTIRSDEGMNSLDCASFRNSKQLINLLLKYGAKSTILEAVVTNNLEEVKELLGCLLID